MYHQKSGIIYKCYYHEEWEPELNILSHQSFDKEFWALREKQYFRQLPKRKQHNIWYQLGFTGLKIYKYLKKKKNNRKMILE